MVKISTSAAMEMAKAGKEDRREEEG